MIERAVLDSFLPDFLEQHRLPQSFADTATEYFIPLSERIFAEMGDQTYVLGVNGAQGAGKSTLADFIGQYLQHAHGLNVVSLSIDDIYLTKAEREALGRQVHPLLITRGVPGTHDIALGCHLVRSLKALGEGESLSIPRFDKSKDDRKPRVNWDECVGPVDLIILEGWCVGSVCQSEEDLASPINQLEAEEDRDGRWRQYVNQQLTENYPVLFDMLDCLILLKSPSFECVHGWRVEQEKKLAAALERQGNTDATDLMNEAEIARFITHYERITRNNLERLPERAYAVVELDESRHINSVCYQSN